MRPHGRWGIFVLALGLAWGVWWGLDRRKPGAVGEIGRVEGGRTSAATPDGPPGSEGPQAPEAGAPSDGPTIAAESAGPPSPSEPVATPGPAPGLDDLSGVGDSAAGPPGPSRDAEDEPIPAKLGGFDGLPAVDDQLGLASTAARLSPDIAADIRRGEQAQQDGRLADAEKAFLEATRRAGDGAVEARKKLAEVYWLEGRFEEVRALAEAIWREADRIGAHDDARAMLQFHMALTLNPLPIDRIRAALERARERAPQDDRVWLGHGLLAVREGRLGEARSWLDGCRRRRPDDPAVWRARLEWAMAADRVDEAREAVGHPDGSESTPAQVHRLRAWLAAHRGEKQAETRALEECLAADPGDVASLERLAELAARDGRIDEAHRLRGRKAQLDEKLHRYRTLFRADDAMKGADELARLAEDLSRPFEARGLWTLVQERTPDDPAARAAIVRLDRAGSAALAAGPTLADLTAEASSLATGAPSTAAVPRRIVPAFRDDAAAAGLTFTLVDGETPRRQLPETMSGGVGLLDYDGDGRLDVYFVQGGVFPPDGSPGRCGDRLFRNRGDGTFEDATRSSGVAGFAGGYGHGIAVGDYDNDGHPDLFVTRWRSYALYRNRGDGTFEDATASAGLGGDRDWPTSSAFADLDGDGDLDLYVCHYLAWDAEKPEICRSPGTGRVTACDPLRFAARPDHLFRNDGGRFVDVTRGAGIVDADGRGLGVVAADFDGDGRVDLFVANDGTANFLFLNRGGLTFEEAGHAAGVAASAGGGYRAGMGIARGDLDGDGRLDLAVTNFFGESTTFYQDLGEGLFADRTAAVGLAAPSRYRLGFGVAFLDADDDGRLDLLTANGHIADERPEIPYAMPAQLMLGGANGRLTDVSAAAGPPFQVPRLGRALAVGDLDDDGRLDAILVGHEGPAAYFHNAGPGGHSITLRLEGTRSNRDAVGARVVVEAGGRRQVADRFGGGSYQSAGDHRLHFGLGESTRAEAVEVRWPSGRVEHFTGLAADAVYLIREGDAVPRPIGGRAGIRRWSPGDLAPSR